MMGQNDISDTTNSIANGQGLTNPTPIDRPSASRLKFPLKGALIFVAAALVGAGITTAIFLLFINRPSGETGPTAPIEYASEENDDTSIKEKTVDDLDDKISSSTDESEKLSLRLNKVDYYQINEEYDKALEILNAIDLSTLDSDDMYRVYTYYASTYTGKNDTAQAKHYEDLANEILNQTYPE